MKGRYWIISVVILCVTLVLAFPLRPIVERTVVVPTAYILWVLGLLYRAMPQVILWGVMVILVALVAIGSFIPKERYVPRQLPGSKPLQGPVEGFSNWIKKAEGGIYYKWLVAHRLGKIAHQMLVQQEGNRPRSFFTPLVGADWQPREELQAYFETGLHGSFADYPQSSNPMKPAARTPLDLEIGEAIHFLESKMETERERHS